MSLETLGSFWSICTYSLIWFALHFKYFIFWEVLTLNLLTLISYIIEVTFAPCSCLAQLLMSSSFHSSSCRTGLGKVSMSIIWGLQLGLWDCLSILKKRFLSLLLDIEVWVRVGMRLWVGMLGRVILPRWGLFRMQHICLQLWRNDELL